MDINLLNKLNEEGILKNLFFMGIIKAEIFIYIEIYNKYLSLKPFIKKDSHRRRIVKNYFSYSKANINRVIHLFENYN